MNSFPLIIAALFFLYFLTNQRENFEVTSDVIHVINAIQNNSSFQDYLEQLDAKNVLQPRARMIEMYDYLTKLDKENKMTPEIVAMSLT
jgi:hypothetical protein